MATTRGTWDGYLPKHAVAMAQVRAQAFSNPETPVTSLPAGQGDPQVELYFVGNASKDSNPASELLGKMIEAMGLKRDQVFLCDEDQMHALTTDGPFPKIIVALGQQAAHALLQSSAPLSELRGRFHEYGSARVLPTFHPADLLQNPESKRLAWADLQQVTRELGLKLPSKTDKKA